MAYTYLTHAAKVAGATNTVTTTGVDTSGADLLVVFGVQASGGTYGTISDSVGGNSNTWTALTSLYQSGTTFHNEIQAWYCQGSLHVGASHTFTLSGGSSSFGSDTYPQIAMLAFSGSAASPVIAENGAGAQSASSLQTGSVDPGANNDALFVSGCATANGKTATVGSSFTNVDTLLESGGYGIDSAYFIQGSASALNPTWTPNSGTCDLACCLAALKVSGGAAATVWTPLFPLIGLQ